MSSLTAGTLLAEAGSNPQRFPAVAAFASWLGLWTDNRISGAGVLSVKTRKAVSRLPAALSMVAESLHRSRSYFGQYFCRP